MFKRMDRFKKYLTYNRMKLLLEVFLLVVLCIYLNIMRNPPIVIFCVAALFLVITLCSIILGYLREKKKCDILLRRLENLDKPYLMCELLDDPDGIVEDNGTGIASEDLNRIFEKGFTGKRRNTKNATGMGLYIAKKLCDRLGLSLSIESADGEYCRAILIFPKGGMHKF